MRRIGADAFAQRAAFSSDWHADTFAGATVRRLSRAMWGYDIVSDAAWCFGSGPRPGAGRPVR